METAGSVTLDLSDDLLKRLDSARGDVTRPRYVLRALLQRLDREEREVKKGQ